MLKTIFPQASNLIYGCMGLGGGWESSRYDSSHINQAEEVIETAIDSGIRVFDHADIYTHGKAEAVFGEVLKKKPSLRDKMILQSKCAIRFKDDLGPKRYDFSTEWIRSSVEHSLRRLHTEQLDILLLHRPDPLMQPEQLADVISQLISEGKIAHIGVSNMHAHQIAFLETALNMPVIVNQLEMSLAHRDWLEDGLTTGSKLNRHVGYAPGTLEYCWTHNVQLQAWGSLAQGRFSGRPTQSTQDEVTTALVRQLAENYSTSAEAIILAWLMRHPIGIQPVVGTTNIHRIRACAQANNLTLSREDWYLLLETARGQEVP
ncbi:aldo/keto reductase [Alteromonas sp. ASW11-130]|uniref:aldo/keto reductase n=1 Tax=Alteromonas sp. ASW11-130 TaxID=3015775 RepID=UPI00224200EA|nr:aldo/keto reductase [Alteromonas sp. ASW11-130]MCW8090741.1 aldo/keto reductase [Alteromonas sp. ASW11-130]